MGWFDFSRWKTYKFHYIIILIIIILIIIYIVFISQPIELKGDDTRMHEDGNGTIFYKGRGSEDESVEELLNRIEWSSYLFKRTSLIDRTLLISITLTIVIILLIFRSLPKPTDIVLLIIVIFVIIFAIINFFYVHGDIYNDYYIKNNVHLIRDKLNLHRSDPDAPLENNIPNRFAVSASKS